MRHALLALVFVILIPIVAVALPREDMVFKVVGSKDQTSKVISSGIAAAIAEMSFITKPIAKKKLENSNIAMGTIKLSFPAKKVAIQHDERKVVDSPADGSKVKWVREDGESFMVSQKVGEKDIVQTFHADEGVKTLKYVFNDDFTKLTVHVTLDSPKLSGPLKYKLEYAK